MPKLSTPKKYIVNENSKIVIAQSTSYPEMLTADMLEEALDHVKTKEAGIVYESIVSLAECNDLDVETPVKGIARCHNKDQFDRNKGMNVAGAKCDRSYNSRMARGYAKAAKRLKEAADYLESLSDIHAKKEEELSDLIKNA